MSKRPSRTKYQKETTSLWDFDTFQLQECFPPNDRIAIGILCLMQVDNDLETVRELIRLLGRQPHDRARRYLYEARLRFLIRLTLGLVHNALSDVLDGKSKEQRACCLMAENEFAEIVGKLPGTCKKAYETVEGVISNHPKPLWPALCRIRHNGVFHYSWTAFNKEVERVGPAFDGAVLVADPINERRFLVSDVIADSITFGKPNLGDHVEGVTEELFALRDSLQAAIQGLYYAYVIHRGLRGKIKRET